MESKKVRSIKELKEEILKVKNEVEPGTWTRLTKLLDELFVAYFLQAQEKEIAALLDELYHYERHSKQNIHDIVMDFREIVENRKMSDSKASYQVKEMIRNGEL